MTLTASVFSATLFFYSGEKKKQFVENDTTTTFHHHFWRPPFRDFLQGRVHVATAVARTRGAKRQRQGGGRGGWVGEWVSVCVSLCLSVCVGGWVGGWVWRVGACPVSGFCLSAGSALGCGLLPVTSSEHGANDLKWYHQYLEFLFSVLFWPAEHAV